MTHIMILDGVFASYRGERVQVVCLFTDGAVRMAECYRPGGDDDPIEVPVAALSPS